MNYMKSINLVSDIEILKTKFMNFHILLKLNWRILYTLRTTI